MTTGPWSAVRQTAVVREAARLTPGSAAGVHSGAVQRRAIGTLSVGVAVAGLGVTVGVTVGRLLARDVAGTDSAAGLGTTTGVLGAAVLAVPSTRISDRSGRRAGLAAGHAVAVVGAPVTAQGGTDLVMGLGAAVAGIVGGPLQALGGFGLVTAVSAALVPPLAVVWVTCSRTAVSGPGSS